MGVFGENVLIRVQNPVQFWAMVKKEAAPKKEKVLSEQEYRDIAVIKRDLMRLMHALDAMGIRDFVTYLHSPKKLIWTNFVAGMFKGLGILVGMTVMVAVLIWILNQIVDFPLIGQYFEDLKNILESATPDVSYR